MSKWETKRLGDLVDIFDGPHSTPTKTKHGPVFLGISNLNKGRLDLSEVEHLSEEDLMRWTRRVKPLDGDIVFSYETRIGEAARIPAGLECCLGRRLGLLRAKESKVDEHFLLYAYLGPAFQETLRSRTIHGSTVDRIPLIDMPDFPIEIPTDIHEQRAIASILGSLDEKIDLNHKTCETLEEMARAIFKSWFVDFEPVRAKMAGEKPTSICERLGLTREILSFFPNKLVRSESGEIPEGWDVVSLNDLARLSTESISPSDYPDEYFDHYSIPAFDLNMLPAKDLGHEIMSNKYIVIRDSVLVSKLNPETPRAWMPVVGTAKAVCSTEFMQFVPKNHKHRVFLYGLLTSAPVQEAILCRITGSTGSRQRAQPLSVAAMNVLAPSIDAIQVYCAISSPLFDEASKRRTENRILTSIRDELLPKLISGEIEAPINGGIA